MNILSLFDGISCGRIALDRANIKVDNYFSSEIDEHAKKISKLNWPDNIQVGDVTKISYKNGILKTEFGEYKTSIDLVIGGSPCQSFSQAGDGSGFDGKSGLYWHFHRILNEIKNENDCKFLLENVKMKIEWADIISKSLNVQPVLINSSLVSAQKRKRLYWANFEIDQPDDKYILLKDILEESGEFYSQKAIDYLNRAEMNKRYIIYPDDSKSNCVVANFCKGVPYNVFSYEKELKLGRVRKFTPTEVEKLQTIPMNYTYGISNTQRYKCLGNGWTVDVIKHILSKLS